MQFQTFPSQADKAEDLTTTESRGRREIEQSQIGPKGEPRPWVATVFSRGGGLEGFEGGIEVDDEFAHEGGEGDFGRFAFGSEALVNFLED